MMVTRRNFIQTGTFMMTGANIAAHQQSGTSSSGPGAIGVQALVFDTFGTVVDWRTSVAREVEALARRKGAVVAGERFADAWGAGCAPSMNRVRTGELAWTKLDALHRMTLDKILAEFKF